MLNTIITKNLAVHFVDKYVFVTYFGIEDKTHAMFKASIQRY